MEIEELLFRKHMKDAQRGQELISDKEYLELEKQWKEASKGARIRPVEVKVDPKVDLDDLATMDDFVNDIISPHTARTKRLAEAWERHLLEECLHMGVWRIWFVQWCEYRGTSAFMNTKVFPPWDIKAALALAKKVGEHIVGINLKRWLLMGNDEFVRESGSSPNKDAMMEMRRVLGERCKRKCR